jgi:hypothetical protein
VDLFERWLRVFDKSVYLNICLVKIQFFVYHAFPLVSHLEFSGIINNAFTLDELEES